MSVSSTELDTQEGVGTEAPENGADTGASAEPPAADNGKSPATMLDAVKAAVGESAGEAAPASNGEDGDPAGDDPAAESADGQGEDDEFTEEETSRLHSKTRRRVKKLVAKVHGLTGELEQVRPLAQRMHQVDSYIQQSGLTYDEVNQGFQIMSLMKADPKSAYEALKPYMESLESALGIRLPEDLHQKVQQGYTAPDVAAELAQRRAREARLTGEIEQQRQRSEITQHQNMVSRVVDAVSRFENDLKTKDPDYAAKQPRLQEKFELATMKALRAGQPPNTPEAARALLQKCLDEVNAEFRKLVQPKPKELRPLSGGASAAAAPRPQTTLDVVKMAVGQS